MEALIGRALMLLGVIGPRPVAVAEILMASGVSASDAFLAVKAAEILARDAGN